jgi:hypothetical protein
MTYVMIALALLSMTVCFTMILLGAVHVLRCLFDPEYRGARK